MTMKRDKIFQKIIRSNLSTLCESTDCHSSFLDIFVQKNLLSPYEKEVILGKGPKYERSSEFYFKIVQKGPSAYKIVVNALRKTDQNFAADILVHNGGILRDDILRGEDNSGFSGSVVSDAMDLTGNYIEEAANSFNQLSMTSPLLLTPLQRLPTVPQSNITQPGGGVVPYNFPTPERPFNLLESKPGVLEEYLKPYSLQSSPKGYALIINIISFDHYSSWFRDGASHDTEQLSRLFQDLGYVVYAIEDLTASQFGLVLEEFKVQFKNQPVDSSIVSVMSHGDEGDNIYTRDRAVINVKQDILEKFNNVNCPQLKGKPKLFFFQFCRGDFTDYGARCVDEPDSKSFRSRTVSDNAMTQHTTIPTWTDMLVCYSSLEGHYAYRETDAGSWFIQILCETLRKYGNQFDICELLNLVAEIMKTRAGEKGEKQICPFTNIGFTKKFYFNKTT